MEMNLAPNFTDRGGASSLLSESTLTTAQVPNGTYSPYPNDHDGMCDVNSTDEYHNFYLTAQFVTGLIIYPILCVTGIIGNSLSLIVLSHKEMATSTNVYLLALCISDTLKLLNDLLYFIMLVISLHNPVAAEAMTVNVYPYAHYVLNVAVSVTAWLTVSVAFDRYVSVCFPSRAVSLCTIIRARMVVTSVFASMLLLSIPTGFRYRLQTIHDTLNNQTCQQVVVTELGRNQEFMIPYTWVHNLLRGIIPVFILIFLNARIINVLRMERVKGKKFSSRNRITLMLIAMIVLFIVCITPDAIMSTFFGKGYVEEGSMVKGVREITDSLVTFNSAVNFILYCSLSVHFRNTFARIFLGQRFARNRSGSCRPQSTNTHAACDNNGHSRRKSGGRLSLRMKNVEYTDLDQDSPPKEKKKKNIKMPNNTKTRTQNPDSKNSDGPRNPESCGVWLGYEKEADLVFEQTGGVWLGPVTNNYNNNTAETETGRNILNSSTDRRISNSTNSKEDSTSDSTHRIEPSSNGTSISGYYTAADLSDKGSTPEETNDINSLPKKSGEGKTQTLISADSLKMKSKKLAWKLDPPSSTEESPIIMESSNESQQKAPFQPDENGSGNSNKSIKNVLSDKERPLLQLVYNGAMTEGSLV